MCYPPLPPLDSADDKASKSSSVHCIFSSSSQFFSYVFAFFFLSDLHIGSFSQVSCEMKLKDRIRVRFPVTY